MRSASVSVLARASLGVVLLVLPGEGLAAQGAPDLPRHELIFARHSGPDRSDYDVWRMCGDGTQLASLLILPGHQIQLSVAPDGGSFLYMSEVDGQREVFRKSFGRGEPENLTQHPSNDAGGFFSPDGRRMGFFSTRDAARQELYLMDLASKAVTRLTTDTLYDAEGRFFPDGERIVFTRFFPGSADRSRPGAGEIMLLEVATGRLTQLTQLGGYNGGVSVSPDGRRLAWHRSSETGSEIWVSEADGSNARAITETRLDEYSPAWSPDGNWLAFTGGIGDVSSGRYDLWLMRPDGSDRRVLNAAENSESWLAWRPGDTLCR